MLGALRVYALRGDVLEQGISNGIMRLQSAGTEAGVHPNGTDCLDKAEPPHTRELRGARARSWSLSELLQGMNLLVLLGRSQEHSWDLGVVHRSLV